MAFLPRHEDLVLFRSMAIDHFQKMSGIRLPGMKANLDAYDMGQLAQLRAAIALLNKLGAVKPGWIEKNSIDTDKG